jgi:hypothetical protein
VTRQTGAAAEFFRRLGELGRPGLFDGISGTLRFDIADGRRTDHWYVTITKGELTVSADAGPADVVVAGGRPLLDEIASGAANAFTAVLRCALTVHGHLGLLITFQRLFPGPEGLSRAAAPDSGKAAQA